jgi:hypothetical protein
LHIRGIRVDRGRLVREAIAVLMADLEAGIDASVIARRLRAVGQPVPAGAVPALGASVTGATVDGVPPDDAYGAAVNGAAVTSTAAGGGPAGPQ